jgi:hypothetical protein
LADDDVPAALQDRLTAAASILLRHAGAYTVLIRSDFDSARTLLLRRVVVAAVLWAAVLLALQLACAWLVAVTWNTPARGWVVAALVAFFCAVAIGAGWRLHVLADDAVRPGGSRAAREWAKDRALLGELLTRLRASTQ